MATNKVWLITGSSKGFGRVWAEAALARGDRVAATARDIGTLSDLVAKYGERVAAVRLDVTDKAAVDAAVADVHRRFGRAGERSAKTPLAVAAWRGFWTIRLRLASCSQVRMTTWLARSRPARPRR